MSPACILHQIMNLADHFNLLSGRTLASAALVLACMSASASAADIVVQQWGYVNPPTTPPPGANFLTIQSAINSSSAGDRILVRSNVNGDIVTTYPESIVFPALNIEVLAQPTHGSEIVIDATLAGGSVVTINSPANTRSSVLEGFTVTGGVGAVDPFRVPAAAPPIVGGGIYCLNSTPTIRNCRIVRNKARQGGGLYVHMVLSNPLSSPLSGPLIVDCQFVNNFASAASGGGYLPSGGGLHAVNCSIEIESTTFSFNRSDDSGGGASWEPHATPSDPPLAFVNSTIEDCDFHDNLALAHGGAISAVVNSNLSVSRTLINSNRASDSAQTGGGGGGIYWEGSSLTIESCDISSNFAGAKGGGVLIESDGGDMGTPSLLKHTTINRNSTGSDLTAPHVGGGVSAVLGSGLSAIETVFDNCLIVSNESDSAGGVDLDGSAASFSNCTISQNKARGTFVAGGVRHDDGASAINTVKFTNCILDQNLGGLASSPVNAWEVDFFSLGTQAQKTITFTIMQKGASGTGLPAFMASASNLTANPRFVLGSVTPYSSNQRFYLSHSPQQVANSPAYDAGSFSVGPTSTVYGRTCRTLVSLPGYSFDTGIVDIGFHYAETVLSGMP